MFVQYSITVVDSPSFPVPSSPSALTMPIPEEILESPIGRSQHSDTPSSMAILEGCSNFTIAGSHLNSVVGSQHNNIYNGPVTIQQVMRGSDERQLTIWDEFERIPTGKVYITKTWCTTNVKWDPDYNRWKNHKRRDIEAQRTINTARIGSSEYLHIGYSGVDASEAYHTDFEHFARMRNANSVQLFGYTNRVGIPALIFYDELVPVSFVWERNGFSSALFIYFSHLSAQIDPELPLRELWINPRNGLLRKGPYVEDSTNISYTAARFQTGLLSNTSDTPPSLGLQEYNNTDVLYGYLSEFLSVHDILQGVRGSAKYSFELVKDDDAASILLSLPGTIYSRTSREPVCRWSAGKERRYYHVRAAFPELSQERMYMEDGSLRLTFMLSDMRDFQTFWLQYGLYPAKEWSALADTWLLLAHHIFQQLGVQQNEREFYAIYSGFWLHCECQECEPPQGPIDMPIETPVYLFMRPIPRPFDDKKTWNTWAQRKKYFWSFDPSGYPGEISDAENQQRNLGLRSLEISIVIQHRFWVQDHYDTIRMFHALQGFDPSSTDFARSLGLLYHEFEIFDPNSGRFEEIKQPERNQRSIKTWFHRLGQSLRIRRNKSKIRQ